MTVEEIVGFVARFSDFFKEKLSMITQKNGAKYNQHNI